MARSQTCATFPTRCPSAARWSQVAVPVPARSSRTQHLRTWSHAWGFAWDPLHNGRTAVRGGAGLFDVLPLPYQFILLTTQAAPFFQYTSLNTSASDPSCPPGTTLTFPPRLPLVSSVRTNCARRTWNLTPSATTSRNGTLMSSISSRKAWRPWSAYVGSRGVHQPFRVDEADLIIPTKTSAGYLWPQVDVNGNLISGPNAGNPPDPINPKFGSVRGNVL